MSGCIDGADGQAARNPSGGHAPKALHQPIIAMSDSLDMR